MEEIVNVEQAIYELAVAVEELPDGQHEKSRAIEALDWLCLREFQCGLLAFLATVDEVAGGHGGD